MGRKREPKPVVPQFELDMAAIVFTRIFGGEKTIADMFYNLCFCILVPQSKFLKTKVAVEALKLNHYMTEDIPRSQLVELISSVRFKNNKSISLSYMKAGFNKIKYVLNELKQTPFVAREFLINNVHGLGFKTASHFMRNMGYTDFAIIDSHIIKFLEVETPCGISDYREYERMFLRRAEIAGVVPAIFDLAIWKYYSGVPWEEVTF
jgi:N-glycosylase/DNA lyase